MLVLVSMVLLSSKVLFAEMVLLFKDEIERWGFLCGPKIWIGITSTLLFYLELAFRLKLPKLRLMCTNNPFKC